VAAVATFAAVALTGCSQGVASGLSPSCGVGFAIINFVWWIGIGHAGTLISAILLLFKQGWRNSINRLPTAMTIFAVSARHVSADSHWPPVAGYWLLPYPNTMNVWRSSGRRCYGTCWVSTYATISCLLYIAWSRFWHHA